MAYEQILYITIGVLDKKSSLVTCTDKRLIMISSDLIGTTQREIKLERISYIEQSKSIIFGKIIVWDESSKLEIDRMPSKSVPIIADIINEAKNNAKRNTPIIQQTSSMDVINQLERLANLMDKGILTEDEFQQQKTKVVNYSSL